MTHHLARTTRLAAAALWLAMAAVMSAALVAPGWMVSPNADGAGFRVEICTGQGARTVTLGPDGEILPGGGEPRAHDPACAFAQAVQPLAPTGEAFVAQPAIAPAAPAPLHQTLHVLRAVDPHPARGPPARPDRLIAITDRA